MMRLAARRGHVRNLVGRLLRENKGQDIIEYALLAALISLVVVGWLIQIGVSLDGWYTDIADVFLSIPVSP